MVLFTTGTGNSFAVANKIAYMLGDNDRYTFNQALDKDRILQQKRLILVMPIHSWGPAIVATRFIRQMDRFIPYINNKVIAVFVCGDMCGNADKVIDRQLRKKGLRLAARYSIQMPNNYIVMKGFGLDPIDVQEKKLAAAPERIRLIVESIKRGDGLSDDLYVRGPHPWLKTSLVYPLFTTFWRKHVVFHLEGKCSHCRHCAVVCPTHNITLDEEKRPVWGNDCVQCLACIHRCPEHAIQYKDITQNQGRYHHPDLL